MDLHLSVDDPTPAETVRDRDGDRWVLRDDGWCCQAQCSHGGQLVTHSCDEHDHFAWAEVAMLFGPLTTVEEASDG